MPSIQRRFFCIRPRILRTPYSVNTPDGSSLSAFHSTRDQFLSLPVCLSVPIWDLFVSSKNVDSNQSINRSLRCLFVLREGPKVRSEPFFTVLNTRRKAPIAENTDPLPFRRVSPDGAHLTASFSIFPTPNQSACPWARCIFAVGFGLSLRSGSFIRNHFLSRR